MFDSLKKKFAEASGKLRNKVEDEAKEENNVELLEESLKESEDKDNFELDEEIDDLEEDEDISEEDFDSKLDDALNALDSEEESEEPIEDSEDKKSDEDGSKEEESEDSVDDFEDEEESKDSKEDEEIEEEPKKERSGFFSFLKRDKKDSDKESEDDIDEDLIEYIDDDLEDETSDDFEEEKEIEEESKDTKEDISVEELDDTEEDTEDTEESEDTKEEDEEKSEEEDSQEEKPKKRRSLFRRKDKSKDEEKEEDEKKSGGGFLSFIREKTISESDIDDILFELELGLLEADVAMDVSSVVVDSVKNDLVGQKIKRSSDIEKYTYEALKKAVYNIINIEGKSMTELLEEKVAQGEPLVVMLVGINGTGKTTTIGKLSNFYIKKGYTPVIAASDTFRAGAIEQVGYHADNLGVKLIKHEKGSDPAAVAFDAVQHAKAKGKELVLIDTAGRMQTNTNLMDEMKKIRRVSKPDLVVFVGDALTGNDATEQARKFNEAIDIDGVILTKADADSKGGAALSVGYIIQKPILFLGMGQSYDDIVEYDPDWMLEQIFA